MGVLYGGVAHVPLSALILVCELAGNYDLLVPLMLALGISFIALERVSLYDAQVPTLADSPVHRSDILMDVLRTVLVHDVVPTSRAFICFQTATSAVDMLGKLVETEWQAVFPVLGDNGKVVGLVTAEALHVVAIESDEMSWILASDLMQPVVSVRMIDDLKCASQRLLTNSLREIPVVDDSGAVVALLDEADLSQWHMRASSEPQNTPLPPSRPSWEPPTRWHR
jgi:CIC family chloride channel protein